METRNLQELIARYLDGDATSDEKVYVEKWYDSIRGEELSMDNYRMDQLKSEIQNSLSTYINDDLNAEVMTTSNDLTTDNPYTTGDPYKKIWPFIDIKWAAAILITALSITFYFVMQRHHDSNVVQLALKNDIAPGGNRALLTLADGSVVVLDSAKNGNISRQGGTTVQKSSDGHLVYNYRGSNRPAASEMVFNTIATPRGGQYQVVLPDGSKVWLNAASSLKFPTAFAGRERSVELTGEAYFEVVKNAAKPFRVKSTGQTIEVLGTHFDINSYADEPVVKTTLLEGSVKIVRGAENIVLKPGQQSSFSTMGTNPILINSNVDVNEVLAWKNEMFQFNEADIEVVMRQIARWYNVEVVFSRTSYEDHFSGKISRNENISQILKILELSGANFKIEGKKIIVK